MKIRGHRWSHLAALTVPIYAFVDWVITRSVPLPALFFVALFGALFLYRVLEIWKGKIIASDSGCFGDTFYREWTVAIKHPVSRGTLNFWISGRNWDYEGHVCVSDSTGIRLGTISFPSWWGRHTFQSIALDEVFEEHRFLKVTMHIKSQCSLADILPNLPPNNRFEWELRGCE